MTTYELCKALLRRNKLSTQLLDVFVAADRLTPEQYSELVAMIQPKS